jgi:hypothetical protein
VKNRCFLGWENNLASCIKLKSDGPIVVDRPHDSPVHVENTSHLKEIVIERKSQAQNEQPIEIRIIKLNRKSFQKLQEVSKLIYQKIFKLEGRRSSGKEGMRILEKKL